ncbi:pentapeptide repeat-containing protein, partial [Candidatus Saccharibacteria bacterium]|nr:pentapeptide repeat-containing protein [Candidatus Saccharibacteria bacterium]
MKILKPTLSQELVIVEDITQVFDEDESVSDVHVDTQQLNNFKLKHLSIASSLFSKTDLSGMNVEKLQLLDCEFKSCNFTASSFPNSSWHVIAIDNARCTGMQLTESTIKNVTFKNSKLELMNFRFSNLQNVVF